MELKPIEILSSTFNTSTPENIVEQLAKMTQVDQLETTLAKYGSLQAIFVEIPLDKFQPVLSIASPELFSMMLQASDEDMKPVILETLGKFPLGKAMKVGNLLEGLGLSGAKAKLMKREALDWTHLPALSDMIATKTKESKAASPMPADISSTPHGVATAAVPASVPAVSGNNNNLPVVKATTHDTSTSSVDAGKTPSRINPPAATALREVVASTTAALGGGDEGSSVVDASLEHLAQTVHADRESQAQAGDGMLTRLKDRIVDAKKNLDEAGKKTETEKQDVGYYELVDRVQKGESRGGLLNGYANWIHALRDGEDYVSVYIVSLAASVTDSSIFDPERFGTIFNFDSAENLKKVIEIDTTRKARETKDNEYSLSEKSASSIHAATLKANVGGQPAMFRAKLDSAFRAQASNYGIDLSGQELHFLDIRDRRIFYTKDPISTYRNARQATKEKIDELCFLGNLIPAQAAPAKAQETSPSEQTTTQPVPNIKEDYWVKFLYSFYHNYGDGYITSTTFGRIENISDSVKEKQQKETKEKAGKFNITGGAYGQSGTAGYEGASSKSSQSQSMSQKSNSTAYSGPVAHEAVRYRPDDIAAMVIGLCPPASALEYEVAKTHLHRMYTNILSTARSYIRVLVENYGVIEKVVLLSDILFDNCNKEPKNQTSQQKRDRDVKEQKARTLSHNIRSFNRQALVPFVTELLEDPFRVRLPEYQEKYEKIKVTLTVYRDKLYSELVDLDFFKEYPSLQIDIRDNSKRNERKFSGVGEFKRSFYRNNAWIPIHPEARIQVWARFSRQEPIRKVEATINLSLTSNRRESLRKHSELLIPELFYRYKAGLNSAVTESFSLPELDTKGKPLLSVQMGDRELPGNSVQCCLAEYPASYFLQKLNAHDKDVQFAVTSATITVNGITPSSLTSSSQTNNDYYWLLESSNLIQFIKNTLPERRSIMYPGTSCIQLAKCLDDAYQLQEDDNNERENELKQLQSEYDDLLRLRSEICLYIDVDGTVSVDNYQKCKAKLESMGTVLQEEFDRLSKVVEGDVDTPMMNISGVRASVRFFKTIGSQNPAIVALSKKISFLKKICENLTKPEDLQTHANQLLDKIQDLYSQITDLGIIWAQASESLAYVAHERDKVNKDMPSEDELVKGNRRKITDNLTTEVFFTLKYPFNAQSHLDNINTLYLTPEPIPIAPVAQNTNAAVMPQPRRELSEGVFRNESPRVLGTPVPPLNFSSPTMITGGSDVEISSSDKRLAALLNAPSMNRRTMQAIPTDSMPNIAKKSEAEKREKSPRDEPRSETFFTQRTRHKADGDPVQQMEAASPSKSKTKGKTREEAGESRPETAPLTKPKSNSRFGKLFSSGSESNAEKPDSPSRGSQATGETDRQSRANSNLTSDPPLRVSGSSGRQGGDADKAKEERTLGM